VLWADCQRSLARPRRANPPPPPQDAAADLETRVAKTKAQTLSTARWVVIGFGGLIVAAIALQVGSEGWWWW
jgi:hypothetical protein